jgi:hypothetical protein
MAWFRRNLPGGQKGAHHRLNRLSHHGSIKFGRYMAAIVSSGRSMGLRFEGFSLN